MKANRLLTTAVIALGVLLAIAGGGVGIYYGFQQTPLPEPKIPMVVRLDAATPYVILATRAARQDFGTAIETMQQLHPEAVLLEFEIESSEALLEQLREIQPRYALIVIKPDELDVNVAWRWLSVATRIDDDPLVDVSTGYLTGATPDSAAKFANRIAASSHGELVLPGRLIDNLGPNTQANPDQFIESAGCYMVPVFEQRAASSSISHGVEAFTAARLHSMSDAGIVHFGGHGYPDGIVDGLSGDLAGELELPPAVVFNGACYTGVTHRWFEQWTAGGTVTEHTVAPEDCFCLNLLQNSVVGYLAALHPDHGIPVYQEMEYLAYSGASLGDVMRHTHDGVIIANGGVLPAFETFESGMPSPQWNPSEVMLKGTAARILFGDPAMIVSEAFTTPPFDVTVDHDADELTITGELANPELKSEYTDTYHADLASNPQLFNDRALITVDLPDGWESITDLQIGVVQAGGQELPHRLVSYAVETSLGTHRLHVQIDLPTTGYMESTFRQEGARVVVSARR